MGLKSFGAICTDKGYDHFYAMFRNINQTIHIENKFTFLCRLYMFIPGRITVIINSLN